MTVYDFRARDIDGKEVPLSGYSGKVLLIVNVASRCGYTPQYRGLQELFSRRAGEGFSVLAFPCDQFGGQEPGSETEIKGFCETNYKVTFPLFAKVEVNGAGAHPLYRFLTGACPGILGTEAIKWNFTKFLVDRRGVPVERFAPATEPEAIEAAVARLL